MEICEYLILLCEESTRTEINQFQLSIVKVNKNILVLQIPVNHAQLMNGQNSLDNLLEVVPGNVFIETTHAIPKRRTFGRRLATAIHITTTVVIRRLHAIIRNVIEQVLRLLVALHDNNEAVLLLQVVQDLDAVLHMSYLDHQGDFEWDLACDEYLWIQAACTGIQRRGVPLSHLSLEDHLDRHGLHILTSDSPENSAEPAFTNTLAKSIVLIKQLACLLLGIAPVIVRGKLNKHVVIAERHVLHSVQYRIVLVVKILNRIIVRFALLFLLVC